MSRFVPAVSLFLVPGFLHQHHLQHGTTGSGAVGQGLQSEDAVVFLFALADLFVITAHTHFSTGPRVFNWSETSFQLVREICPPHSIPPRRPLPVHRGFHIRTSALDKVCLRGWSISLPPEGQTPRHTGETARGTRIQWCK